MSGQKLGDYSLCRKCGGIIPKDSTLCKNCILKMGKMLQMLTPEEPQKPIWTVVKCPECEACIVSQHRHDFVTCPCGLVSTDGGGDYHRLVVHDSLRRDNIETASFETGEEVWTFIQLYHTTELIAEIRGEVMVTMPLAMLEEWSKQ